MKQLFKKAHHLVLVLSILLVHINIHAQENPLEGRWDLTVDMGGGRLAPSWLEVRHSGVKNLIGRFVADGGSARPVAQVFFDGKKLNFSLQSDGLPTKKAPIYLRPYLPLNPNALLVDFLVHGYLYALIK